MLHFWNFLLDGWITNKNKSSNIEPVKIPIKDRNKKSERLELRLIPDGWEKYSFQKMKALAQDLTGEKYKSKHAAYRAIKKVIQGKN